MYQMRRGRRSTMWCWCLTTSTVGVTHSVACVCRNTASCGSAWDLYLLQADVWVHPCVCCRPTYQMRRRRRSTMWCWCLTTSTVPSHWTRWSRWSPSLSRSHASTDSYICPWEIHRHWLAAARYAVQTIASVGVCLWGKWPSISWWCFLGRLKTTFSLSTCRFT